MDLVKAREVSVGDTILTKGARSSRQVVQRVSKGPGRVLLHYDNDQFDTWEDDEEILIVCRATPPVNEFTCSPDPFR